MNITNLLIIAFVIATIIAIFKSIKETKGAISDIKAGKSLDEIKADMAKKTEEKKERERKKYESKLYKATHILDYGNMLLVDKLENLLQGKGKEK